ncbi:MAG: acetylhydrolase [Planctomycetota bacterium]
MRPAFQILACFLFVVVPRGLSAGEPAAVVEHRFEPRDSERDRVVPVKVYLAQSETPQKPSPVILFSHGLGGSRENNGYLGRHWAAAGYIAVFMQHAGSDEAVWKSVPIRQRAQAMREAASGRSKRSRIADVPFVIDQLETWNAESGHLLEGKLDLNRIGMSGHSFGAVTTLDVAGRKYFNQDFEESRITAFCAFSPQPGNTRDAARAFGHLSKPMICMTGTKDKSAVNASLKPSDRQKVYTALGPGDKYQLVLKDGEHHAFGDSQGLRTRNRNPKHHPAIQQITLKFWDAYLKGDEGSKSWLQSQQPITTTELGEGDRWEWK